MIPKSSYYICDQTGKDLISFDDEINITTKVKYYDIYNNLLDTYVINDYPNNEMLKNKLDPLYKPRPTKIEIRFGKSCNKAIFYNKNGKMFEKYYNGEIKISSIINKFKSEIDYEWCLRNEIEIEKNECIIM